MNRRALLLVALVAIGCMDEGRQISQESIDALAREQQKDYDAIVVAARVNPVSPEIADRIASMDNRSTQIRKWTALTKADLGRAEGDVDLTTDGQASARAMYRAEIERRKKLEGLYRGLMNRATGGIVSPGAESTGDLATSVGKVVAGPIGAAIFGLLWKRQKKKTADEKKKREDAEAEAERKRRAVREAIAVIGQSKDTSIRQTAAMKSYLLREFADAKMVDYRDRIREIEGGALPPRPERYATTERISPDELTDSQLLPIDDKRES